MNLGIVKSIFCLVRGCLLLGLLAGATGCTKNPEPKNAEVSGKVLFKGKPLPGGTVAFVAVKGGFTSSGRIEENGDYIVNAPIGEVVISVDNRMFQPQNRPGNGNRFAQAQAKRHRIGQLNSQKELKPIKGRYMKIPERYADGSTSGLTYTVKPGPQTHDIELSDKLPP